MPFLIEWGQRMSAAYNQTGILAKGRAKDSAEEIEELGRELGLAGARLTPQGEASRGAGTATDAH